MGCVSPSPTRGAQWSGKECELYQSCSGDWQERIRAGQGAGVPSSCLLVIPSDAL